MRTVAVFLLLAVAPVFGQGVVTNPMGGLVDAYRDAIRMRMERDRLKMQSDLNRSAGKLLDAQAEAIRLQTEQLKLQNEPHASPQVPEATFNRAVEAVQKRYPDFEQYRGEAARLMGDLDTSNGPSLNLEHYIEGMYLIAKHASFSNKAIPPAPKAADVLTGDPEFHRLPMATRIKFLKAVDPELSKFSDDDWETVLTAIALRLEKAAK